MAEAWLPAFSHQPSEQRDPAASQTIKHLSNREHVAAALATGDWRLAAPVKSWRPDPAEPRPSPQTTPSRDCRLPTADCPLPTAHWQLATGDWRLATGDW
ncbi:hypothetical protein McPS_24710 [Marichromatium sp. PS1]